jgi:RHH-type transcriptional regulator, rel operon repressor / antitoxin RelB
MTILGCKAMLAVRLPQDIEERLTALSKETGRTKSYYVREALIEQLDDLEDLYLAEQRLADIKSGKSKTTSLADVMAEYGLDD